MATRIWTCVFLLGVVGPIAAGIGFMGVYASGGIGLLSRGWTAEHWREVLASPGTWITVGYSFAVGLASLLASVLTALVLLGCFGARIGRGAVAMWWFVPLTMPPLVAALVTLEVWGNAGLIARVAHALGLLAQPTDFPPVLFSGWGAGIVLAHMLLVTPFVVLLFSRLDHLLRLDELVLTARTLGAGRFTAWRRIRVPALLRAAEPTLTIYAIVLMGAFEIPLVVGAQAPSMVSVVIARHFTQFDLTSRPDGYALATVYALVAMTVLVGWFTWRRSGTAMEGAA